MYAQVILPLGVKGTFTYEIPAALRHLAKPGMRVMVQFGKKKLYAAIIREIHQEKPGHFEPKSLLSFLDEKPVVSETQLQFWDWVSSYYMSTIGEVMNAALPHGLKLQSDSDQQVRDRYKPKVENCIGLDQDYQDEQKLSEAMDGLKGAPAQLQALEEYLVLSGKHEDLHVKKDVLLSDLRNAGAAPHGIKSLVKGPLHGGSNPGISFWLTVWGSVEASFY